MQKTNSTPGPGIEANGRRAEGGQGGGGLGMAKALVLAGPGSSVAGSWWLPGGCSAGLDGKEHRAGGPGGECLAQVVPGAGEQPLASGTVQPAQ